MGASSRAGYEIVHGELHRNGRSLEIPKGLLYLALARTGWKGEDGPVSAELIGRLRLVDPRLAVLYLRPDLDSEAA